MLAIAEPVVVERRDARVMNAMSDETTQVHAFLLLWTKWYADKPNPELPSLSGRLMEQGAAGAAIHCAPVLAEPPPEAQAVERIFVRTMPVHQEAIKNAYWRPWRPLWGKRKRAHENALTKARKHFYRELQKLGLI